MAKLFNFDSLTSKIEAYAEAKIKLTTIRVKEKVAAAASKLIPLLILTLIFLFFIIFLSVALSLLLNYLLQSPWLGFVIVSGIYLFFFLLFLWIQSTTRFKRYMKAKLLNAMIKPKDND